MEAGKPYSRKVGILDGNLQVRLGGDAQYDKIGRFIPPLELASCFQTGMADLNDLLCQRNVGAHKNIGV